MECRRDLADSDLQPRSAPKPTSFYKDPVKPSVPEVSLIFSGGLSANNPNLSGVYNNVKQDHPPLKPTPEYESYNVWKYKHGAVTGSSETRLPSQAKDQNPLHNHADGQPDWHCSCTSVRNGFLQSQTVFHYDDSATNRQQIRPVTCSQQCTHNHGSQVLMKDAVSSREHACCCDTHTNHFVTNCESGKTLPLPRNHYSEDKIRPSYRSDAVRAGTEYYSSKPKAYNTQPSKSNFCLEDWNSVPAQSTRCGTLPCTHREGPPCPTAEHQPNHKNVAVTPTSRNVLHRHKENVQGQFNRYEDISQEQSLQRFRANISANRQTEPHVSHFKDPISNEQSHPVYKNHIQRHSAPNQTSSELLCCSENFSQTNSLEEEIKANDRNKREEKTTSVGGNDISVTTLYQIIQLQSKQLQTLQEQVEQLLGQISRDRQSDNRKSPIRSHDKGHRDDPIMIDQETQTESSKSCDIPKRSVGVSTSFSEYYMPSKDMNGSTNPEMQINTGLDQPNARIFCYNRMTQLPVSENCNPRSHIHSNMQDVHQHSFRGQCCQQASPPQRGLANPTLTTVDESLTLHGVDLPVVTENPPSPVNSIHVDMQEYRDSSDEEDVTGVEHFQHNDASLSEDDPNDEPPGNRVGWTFYNNVMGQVNQLLQSSPASNAAQQPGSGNQLPMGHNSLNGDPVESVRNATIEHLRTLGISMEDVDTANRVTFDSVYYPHVDFLAMNTETSECDTSLKMNALALKYLKDDPSSELAKMSNTQRMQDLAMYNLSRKTTNLSVATLRYLERYQIIPPSEAPLNAGPVLTANQNRRPPCQDPGLGRRQIPNIDEDHGPFPRGNPQPQPYHVRSKILDITTLKRQPKLL